MAKLRRFKVLSYNCLLDDLTSNFIPRTMEDPPESVLKEIFGSEGCLEWKKLKEKLGKEYGSAWHGMKQAVVDPHGARQKARVLWGHRNLMNLQQEGWKTDNLKVEGPVILDGHTTFFGMLQKHIPDEGNCVKLHECIRQVHASRSWDNRGPKFLQRFLREQPDVIALQEYDMHLLPTQGKPFWKAMADIGYEGLAMPGPGQEKAGMAIFWKTTSCVQFEMPNDLKDCIVPSGIERQDYGNLDLQEPDFKDRPMDRRPFGFVRLLVHRQPILFCNVHLMTSSRDPAGHIRAWELKRIRMHMRRLALPGEAVLICGDFNINSHNFAEDYIWTSTGNNKNFIQEGHEVKVASLFSSINSTPARVSAGEVGKILSIDSEGDALIDFSAARCQWVSRSNFKDLTSTSSTGYVRDATSGANRFLWNRSDGDDLCLRDSYDDVYGSADKHSTKTGMRLETIDYVFYDESLLILDKQSRSKLECPEDNMPNADEPSDHIPLILEFDLDQEASLKAGLHRLQNDLKQLLKRDDNGPILVLDVLLPLIREAVTAARDENLVQWLKSGHNCRPSDRVGGPPGSDCFQSLESDCSVTVTPRLPWPLKRYQASDVCDEPGQKQRDYDYSKSTKANHTINTISTPLNDDSKYTDHFKDIREKCDESYHGIYTKARQEWQDEEIQKTLDVGKKSATPWLIYTCGPMGVGKSYVLKWLEAQGYFPLMKTIVHIDPDQFKYKMPEFEKYSCESRGTKCHKESAYMMEIAQEAAMKQQFDIWVDGSLKDAKWYCQQFQDIRDTYPHYRIAIFYINAKEEVILKRVEDRKVKEGRGVPPELVKQSMVSMDKTLNTLTPHCDFVARIMNDGRFPTLQAVETIDKRGVWEVIKEAFDKERGKLEFPNCFIPLSITTVASENLKLFKKAGDKVLKFNPEALLGHLQGTAAAACSALDFKTTLPSTLTFPPDILRSLGISAAAKSFCFMYPPEDPGVDELHKILHQDKNPLSNVLKLGAFCYFDSDGKLVTLNALSSEEDRQTLQFQLVSDESRPRQVDAIPSDWLQTVTWTYLKQRGATKFCWLHPNERNHKGVVVGGAHGSFAYQLVEGGDEKLFIFDILDALEESEN
eukprot:TRINITY_DN108051_c0_g1_i1.p1 TRINITY_DN108051_c0_g1~~TRINITY_DN108051_c0_g1_i1.p1  ORF type:complete len:1108 (+),score=173.82 TRINITY_DN108051_c0_g1_i1:48-3371(+)